jgi:nucleotide-binding universal stress UspA family protein
MNTPTSVTERATIDAIFTHVVCGIDTTDESLEAARQAARLVSSEGQLVLVGVANLAKAALIYMGAGAMVESLVADTNVALDRARKEVGSVRTVEIQSLIGLPPRDLLDEAERQEATLLVVGTHGRSRPVGALLGSVASMAVHETSRSVLVARPTPEPARFPRSIVCGVDGCEHAARAAAAATSLAGRLNASLSFIVAEDDENVDLDAARRTTGADTPVGFAQQKPVEALVAASEGADLLVVGSRALQGVRAIGSVSERIAHESACSVLIVRQPN